MTPVPWFYRRLVLSYALVVLVVAMATAGASLGIFQGLYEDQLAALHRVSVANLARALRTEIADPGLSTTVEVAVQLLTPSQSFFGVDDKLSGNTVRVHQTALVLSDLLNRRAESVRAVRIYYPRAALALATDTGLDWRDGEPPAAAAWLEAFAGQNSGVWWRTTAQAPLTLYRLFPQTDNPRDATAVIAVEIRAEVVQRLLTTYARLEGARISLYNPEGRLAFEAGEPVDRTALESRLVVEGWGWSLVDQAPLARLYRNAEPLLLFIAGVTLLVLAGGGLLALFLASRLYAPLGRLLRRVRGQFGRFLPVAEAGNEYAVLGAALEGLSTSLESSRPLIRDEGTRRLLDGVSDPGRAAEALVMLDLRRFPAEVRALYAAWTPGEGTPDLRMLSYALAEALEQFLPGVVLPTVLGGPSLGAIIEAPVPTEGLERWSAWAHETWGCTLRSALGPPAGEVSAIAASFSAARVLSGWGEFFPQLPVLVDRPDLLARETSDAEVSRDLFEAWDRGLRLRRDDEVRSVVERYRTEVSNGACSSRQLRQGWDRLVRQAGEWALSLEVLAEFPVWAGDAPASVDRLEAAVLGALGQVEGRRSVRSWAVVEQVRAYVRGSLVDASLDGAAEAVGLSAGYLSGLFKETAGASFVGFVTETRLEEARTLLLTTSSTVKAIGTAVGYQTPGYFIHQFKAKYGQTPVEFRRRSMRNGLEP